LRKLLAGLWRRNAVWQTAHWQLGANGTEQRELRLPRGTAVSEKAAVSWQRPIAETFPFVPNLRFCRCRIVNASGALARKTVIGNADAHSWSLPLGRAALEAQKCGFGDPRAASANV
jgi:hypothetical protein